MIHDIAHEYYKMLGGEPKKYDKETSPRVLSYCKELDAKRTYNKFTVFDSNTDEMIIGNHLKLFSICEHHLLPFFGEVSIGYIPNGKIFGLSKFQRLVDKISSKPSIQENLTKELADEIETRLHPTGIGIVIRAIHTCVFARGVQSTSAEFTTNAMFGSFRDKVATRQEFLSVVMADGRLRL
jgi:GTP cyclohydrolase IA